MPSLPVQPALFARLPVQHAPDLVVHYAATLGPDRDPRQERAVIKEAACRRLIPDVEQWLDMTAPMPSEGAASIDTDKLLSELMAAADMEAYDFARNLERRFHWTPDHDLIEVLDAYAGIAHTIERDMVRAWVKANGITLDIPAGGRIVDTRPRPGWTLKPGAPKDPQADRIGTVVELRPETAEYVVQFDEETYGGPRNGEIVPCGRIRRLDA